MIYEPYFGMTILVSSEGYATWLFRLGLIAAALQFVIFALAFGHVLFRFVFPKGKNHA